MFISRPAAILTLMTLAVGGVIAQDAATGVRTIVSDLAPTWRPATTASPIAAAASS